jgi:hypothetical protein
MIAPDDPLQALCERVKAGDDGIVKKTKAKGKRKKKWKTKSVKRPLHPAQFFMREGIKRDNGEAKLCAIRLGVR